MTPLTNKGQDGHGDHEKEAGEGENETGQSLRPEGHLFHGGGGRGGRGRGAFSVSSVGVVLVMRGMRAVVVVFGGDGRWGGTHPLYHAARSASKTADLEKSRTSSAAGAGTVGGGQGRGGI